MKTLIGWRTKENEISPHYYCEDDSDPAADAISLCKKFYAIRSELVFPGPSMAFCSECEESASEIKRRPSLSKLKVDIGTLEHHEFYQAAIKALETGIRYDEANMEEHSHYLIALTNAALALYLLLKEKSQ